MQKGSVEVYVGRLTGNTLVEGGGSRMTESESSVIEMKKLRVSVSALVISALALTASIASLVFTLWYQLCGPRVTLYEPTGYAIIRGLYSFPSDHIVLPLEWENSGGQTAVVRHPYLKLHNVQSGQDLIFGLAGEYAEISTEVFKDRYGYKIKRSFLLEPHAVSLRVLVFHISDWWDDKNENYDFRFLGGDCCDVSIGYQVNQEPPVEFSLFEMPIFGSANRLVVSQLDCNG